MANFLSMDLSPRRSQFWLFNDSSGSFELQGYASQECAPDDYQMLLRGLRAVEKQTNVRIVNSAGKLMPFDANEPGGLARMGVTLSAGQPIRTAIVGLSERFSMEPLRRLLAFFNTEITLEINLQKEPNISEQLQKLANTGFDLLVLAGGVNGGPERALRAVINNLRLLAQLRSTNRPQIVYAGNQALADFAKLELEIGDDFHCAGNIQPESGRVDLSFAYPALLNAIRRLRCKEFPSLKHLFDHPNVDFLPSEFARSRMGTWLEQTQLNHKGVLQIHMEPEFCQLLASREDKRMGVFENVSATAEDIEAVADILDINVEKPAVASYMLNKLCYPDFLPSTLEELSIEMAWMHYRIAKTLKRLSALDPDFHYDESLGLRDSFEPIILSGSSFDRLPSYRHLLMTVLDSVLPTGITTLVWDDVELLAPLGVLAKADSLLPTQVVDTDAFTSLATVVCVESPMPADQKILMLEVDEGEGEMRQHHQVFAGDLKRVEVLEDHAVRVYLSPEESSDVGMGLRGLGGWVSTPSSKLGIIVDGRGRPVLMPADPQAKQETRRDWLWELGA